MTTDFLEEPPSLRVRTKAKGSSIQQSYSQAEVDEMVSIGRMVIICNGKVYDLTNFLHRHPGGELPIRYMVGKDATEAVHVFHPPSVVSKYLRAYYVGDFVTANNLGLSKDRLVQDFFELNEELQQLGFYKSNFVYYIPRLLALFIVFCCSMTILHNYATIVGVASSAILLGIVWHGIAFTVHDAGHHSVTGKRFFDDLIGIFGASFIGGLSVGWWQRNHNVHHIVTNDPEHDPDIQHLPFFAVTSRFFQGVYSSYHKRLMHFDIVGKLFVAMQPYLFLPILSFGRFNLIVQSLLHIGNFSKEEVRRYRWFEFTGMIFFWCWFGWGVVGNMIPTWPLRILFIYLSHAATFLLHLQIALSHFGMSTEAADENETFLEVALRTTMDIDCPKWLDWFHGGLQFQVGHHLFPRIPRCHLRNVRPYIEKFCAERGLEYHYYTFSRGNNIMFSALKDIADQVHLLAKSAVAAV